MTSGKQHSPEQVRNLIMNCWEQPVVFREYFMKNKLAVSYKAWQCIKWKIDQWSNMLSDKKMKMRIGVRRSSFPEAQWENSCQTSYMSFKEMVDWSNGKSTVKTTCGKELSSEKYFAYYDYVYLKDEINLDVLKQHVSWDSFGFPGRGADDSTVWIGTAGAHTPCHSDTYGCNLVAQVHGNKRWTLFPPNQSAYLYPTRVPYEESSIYSEVNFTRINTNNFPAIKDATPFVVTLQPGDVLFVPKHWWHFVENLNFSVSINTWIELPSDRKDQLQEALVLHQVASVCQGIESSDIIQKVLNPNMLHVATMTSSEILDCVKNRIGEFTKVCPCQDNASATEPRAFQKLSTEMSDEDEGLCEIERIAALSLPQYLEMTSSSFHVKEDKEEDKRKVSNMGASASDEFIAQALIQSLTDPRVVKVLTDVLVEKLTSLSQ